MPDLAPFPDIEALLVTALAEFGETGTVTPDDLQSRLPFLRIRRLPGTGNLITDAPRVEILAFADTRAEAWSIAEGVRQRLLSNIRAVPKVDRVTSDGLQEFPWPDQSLRVVLSNYDVRTRR